MEFTIDSPHISINIKDKDITSPQSLYPDERYYRNMKSSEDNGSLNTNSLQSPKNIIETSTVDVVTYEIIIKLNDYYLINNIKLYGKLDEINISKLKFQNINTGAWLNAPLFNPDNKENIIKEGEALSVFCVGLTDCIKLRLYMNGDGDEIVPNDIIIQNNLGGTARKQASYKKNLNLDINTGIIPPIERKYNDNVLKQTRRIKHIISKIVIFSQYLYSIPNSTFLMILLNLKNYFGINSQHFQTDENYLASLFLTASSMIQARLFIQAYELFHKMQLYIAYNMDYSNFLFFRILLEVNGDHNLNNLLLSTSSEEIDLKNRIPIFLTKIEIVKAVCMYEHGHMISFFNCLKNCVKMYFINDLSGLKSPISWTKANEVCSDKFYVNNFLLLNGKKLIEVLILILQDKSEIVTFSALKIIEFITDNCPNVMTMQVHKIIKILFSLIYPNETSPKHFNIESNGLMSYFTSKNVCFPLSLYQDYNNDTSSRNISSNLTISPILLKQINYTLDTIINNFDNFQMKDLSLIARKTNTILIDIIRLEDKDSIVLLNAVKLLRKLSETLSSNVIEHFCLKNNEQGINSGSVLMEYLINLFHTTMKSNMKTIFKDYLNRYTTNKSMKKLTTASSDLNLVDSSSEVGSLILFIFEKISDDCVLLSGRESYLHILSAFTNQLELLKNYILNDDDQDDRDFAVFYSYFLLQIVNMVFLNKNEIKSELNQLFFHKLPSSLPDILTKFVNVLFQMEELTLQRKDNLILFEISLELMSKIQKSYNKIFDFNFTDLLHSQYEALLNYISTSGIFNENILYLLKTLPLIELNSNTDPSFIIILQKVFLLILKNFSNYYNEDMFQLFNLFLDKLQGNLPDQLIDEIITAIINKSNYKGSNFKQSCDKLFSVISTGGYFNIVKRNIQTTLRIYSDNMTRYTCEKLLFKDIYIETVDKLELLRKYYEYLRVGPDVDGALNELMSYDVNFGRILLEAAIRGDDTVMNKINEIVAENFDLLRSVGNCGLSRDFNEMLLEELEFVVKYFGTVNRTSSFVAENFKIMQRLVTSFNYVFDMLKNLEDNQNRMQLTIRLKISFYKKLFDTIPLGSLKDSPIKMAITEFINLTEVFLVQATELEHDEDILIYYTLFNQILLFNLESKFELQIIFAIEILLKHFNIQFTSELDIEVIHSFSSHVKSINDSIWEKVFHLGDHPNYKIALFSAYVTQLFAPNDLINSLRKTKQQPENMGQQRKLITFKRTIEDFWLNESRLRDLHYFIKEKIIFELKVKNTLEKANEGIQTVLTNESHKEVHSRKVDEVEEDGYITHQAKNKIENLLDDNLTLEELGVFEAGDEVLENFDEATIPVLKNNYNRKKGSAEKLKTNQNSKQLLMSNHNTGRTVESNEGMSQDNWKLEENTMMKSNIRPLNGLRPSTPPLKIIPVSQVSNKTTLPNTRNLNKGSDTKYEIKSMEELFIDDERNNIVHSPSPQNIYDSFENLNIEDFQNYDRYAGNDDAIFSNTDGIEMNGINGTTTLNGLNGVRVTNELTNNQTSDINTEEYDMEGDLENDYEEVNDDIIDSIDEIKTDEFVKKRENLRNEKLKSRRPPTRYGNRQDQVIHQADSPKNGSQVAKSTIPLTERRLLNINSIFKNKNRFKSLTTGRNNEINKTFNAPTCRTVRFNSFNSPEKSENYSSHLTYDKRNSSLNQIQQEETKSKSIHSLHTLHRANNFSSLSKRNLDIPKKSDFRQTLRLKLTQNSNKILNNLKKLSGIKHSTSKTINHEIDYDFERLLESPESEKIQPKGRGQFEINTNNSLDNIDEYDPSKIRKAVIIADTFTKLLSPLSDEINEAILPICNIPLLEFMIDYLTSSSIKEIIICARNNSTTLERYISKHYKKNKTIKLITSDEFTDVGDCLRKINSEKLITTDFVLIRGLVITNCNLEAAFNYHLTKKKEDKNCILTSIMKNYKNDKFVKTKYDENVLVYNKLTNQILQYEGTNEKMKITLNENVKFVTTPSAKGGKFEPNYFKIRTDLYETCIDICSPEMLTIFSENFDYQSIRDDMYRNVLVSEVYTDTFYVYELGKDVYVGIVKNIDSYKKVNFEILNRWAHPVVLEGLLISPKLKINYKISNCNVYTDADVTHAKAKLGDSIAIASGSAIGEYTEVSSTILGKQTKVGPNSIVKNSILFDGAVIGEYVQINNCVIGINCKIDKGVVLSNCIVGGNVHLTQNESDVRILMTQEEDENGDTVSSVERLDKELFLKNLEEKYLMLEYEEVAENEDEEENDDDDASIEESEDNENYEEEIKNVVRSGIEKSNKVEDIIQEISSLKNAFWEKTHAETLKYVFSAIFESFVENVLSESNFSLSHLAEIEKVFTNWKGIFARFIPTEDVQLQFIAVVEKICLENTELTDAFHIITQLLNSEELMVLSDETIKAWADLAISKYNTSEDEIEIPDEQHKTFVEKMRKFIDQIE